MHARARASRRIRKRGNAISVRAHTTISCKDTLYIFMSASVCDVFVQSAVYFARVYLMRICIYIYEHVVVCTHKSVYVPAKYTYMHICIYSSSMHGAASGVYAQPLCIAACIALARLYASFALHACTRTRRAGGVGGCSTGGSPP